LKKWRVWNSNFDFFCVILSYQLKIVFIIISFSINTKTFIFCVWLNFSWANMYVAKSWLGDSCAYFVYLINIVLKYTTSNTWVQRSFKKKYMSTTCQRDTFGVSSMYHWIYPSWIIQAWVWLVKINKLFEIIYLFKRV